MNHPLRTHVAGLLVACAAACIASTTHASSTKSGSTAARVRLTEGCRVDLERAIGRPLRSEEWPEVLSAVPARVDGWQCPYSLSRHLIDSWQRPLALREEVGVYSFGADGIDDHGEKDDIASWRSVDHRYYPKPPMRLKDLPLLLIPPALLLSLIGIPTWWVFGRRKPDAVRR